ncbi:MAG: amidohydrolase family protein [Actinomycetota bacterium]|nr:amidohydrolase family protein [Actinomycetota bacterium]MDA3024087.1 amidohydrolase family protein [Actinomycetota bacterium]
MTSTDSATTDIIVLTGGTIVDGTGRPGFRADLAIRGERIVAIGANLAGDTMIDVSGLVVAPGFIDIHTHYDAQVFWDPAMTPSCFHGVTTVVAGNCGFSIAPTRASDRDLIAHTMEKVEDMDPDTLKTGIPWDFESFPEYLDSIRKRGTVLNYAAYIGHTPLRLFVMGAEAVGREATDEEIDEMAGLVGQAMEAGAAGFASSFAVTHRGADGQPIPSRWAGRREIEALCKAVGDSGRGVIGVNGGDNLSLADCYELQPRVGAPITFTALLTTAQGFHLKAVETHRAGIETGADVWPQVSCRPLAFSQTMVEPFTLNTNPVFAELMPKSLDERRAAYSDPEWRQRVRTAWDNKQGLIPRWDSYEVMESIASPELIGQRISVIAERLGTDPFDTLLDLALLEHDLQLRFKAMVANDDEAGVEKLLQVDRTTLGLSDAGAHVGQLCDAVAATDLLGKWVRDKKVLTLETAIHKLTKVQADLFSFTDRGELREGAFADVVVFDPTTVGPGPVRRVRDFPANGERLTADQPTGMVHTFVNGQAIVRDGNLVESALTDRPGHLVSPAPR